jgi:hypothetical protein
MVSTRRRIRSIALPESTTTGPFPPSASPAAHRPRSPSPLRFVLAKERNLLQSEKLAYARARTLMPDPARLTKVRKGLNRIKQVMSERLDEHQDPSVRLQLKAFIDSM